ILEQGLKFEPMTMPLEDAQFLESRQFQVPEICRWFRMKPHKIGDLSAATNNNIESESLSYVGDCLQGWFGRIEAECWMKLFLRGEQDSFLVEHVYEALLRGDIQSRYNAYKTGLQWGWITLNEIRKRENMNALPAEIGDVNFFALNMTTAKRVVDGTAQAAKASPPNEPSPGGSPQNDESNSRHTVQAEEALAEVVGDLRGILLDGMNRVLRTEVDKVRRAHSRGELHSWATGFYPGHEIFLRSFWDGPLQSFRSLLEDRGVQLGDEWPAAAAAVLAARHVADSQRDLGTPGQVEQLLAIWIGDRASWFVDHIPEMLTETLLRG
ncbi:MAG TPA: phage portal protein, partial [Phycisphaerales bacterium]|nr:phage portal protein [Phycisphaerales bacterium]